MLWTKNDARKINLLRLIVMFLVVFIDKGASNKGTFIPQSCQLQITKDNGRVISFFKSWPNDANIIEATCEAVRFVDQFVL